MNIQAHAQFEDVYEAQADGVYVFCAEPDPSGNGGFGGYTMGIDNGQSHDGLVDFSVSNRTSFVFFMTHGQKLRHRGAPIVLHGFRIGDEF